MHIQPIRSAAALLVLAFALLMPAGSSAQKPPAGVKPVVSVWKARTCGCCSLWVEHMRASGFEVKTQDVEDIDAIKRKLGVPPALSSCHTAQVGRYVIEGHIPADAVHRLLRERPTTIVGLAVPGMPIGSPGMEVPGGNRQPYAILTFDRNGQTTVYERR
jgi:hypothetical protein